MRLIHFSSEQVRVCEQAVKTLLRACSDAEIEAIIAALQNGDINGCVSRGPRCCLIGTLARVRGATTEQCRAQLALAPEIVREIEYWFFQICSASEETLQHARNNNFALMASLWCEQIIFERASKNGRAVQRKTITLENYIQLMLDFERVHYAHRIFFP